MELFLRCFSFIFLIFTGKCHVRRHFTAANVERKAVHICKYCAKSYVKNATKMQNHLAKCLKFPQRSQQATSNKSPSTSIRGENDESDTLSIAISYGPPGIRSIFDSMEERSQRNANECLARAVYATSSPLMLTGNVYWKRFLNECSSPSIHPSNQTCFIYSFTGCRVQQSSSEGQTNHRESRLNCNHLWWVVKCSWAKE